MYTEINLTEVKKEVLLTKLEENSHRFVVYINVYYLYSLLIKLEIKYGLPVHKKETYDYAYGLYHMTELEFNLAWKELMDNGFLFKKKNVSWGKILYTII